VNARLVLVATPNGDLGDLSSRAVETLAAAELICCADTRRAGRLLQAAGVRGKRLTACDEHTEGCVDEVLTVLAAGGDVAVVTDAGTPAISDTSELLVRAVLDAGFEVSAVPGPAAPVAALVSSGLPTARFVFEGFLPRRGAERRRRLAEIAAERRTVVVSEAPHRLARTIADLAETCGPDRPVAVAGGLTKLYETIARGTLATVDVGDPRGECAIVLGGAADAAADVSDDTIVAAIDVELAAGASSRDAAARVAAALGIARRRAYDVAIARAKRR
jgi:16S rRNA (cytidine1402-2'-O)-methyltransferase